MEYRFYYVSHRLKFESWYITSLIFTHVEFLSTYLISLSLSLFFYKDPPSVPQFYANGTSLNGSLTVIMGWTVFVNCSSSSEPPPHLYRWTKKGLVSVTYNQLLRLHYVHHADEGVYTCTVVNTMQPSFGATQNSSNAANFTLNVLCKYIRKNISTFDLLKNAFYLIR